MKSTNLFSKEILHHVFSYFHPIDSNNFIIIININWYKILIDITISDAEDLKIEVINKLNEMKKIITKIDELEKEIPLVCTEYE